MIGPYDRHTSSRFRAVQPELERIIEKHLPGDFSDWEEKHSSWKGKDKTVGATAYDPRAGSCAWRLFWASEHGADYFGLPKREPQLNTLRDLERVLKQANELLSDLSDHTSLELSRAKNDPQPTIGGVPARLGLYLAIADTLASIPHAIQVMEREGAENYGHDAKAAAVASECRKIFVARTGRSAPRTARDQGQKKDLDNRPALFTQFAQAVFNELGIRRSISGALVALSKIREILENRTRTTE